MIQSYFFFFAAAVYSFIKMRSGGEWKEKSLNEKRLKLKNHKNKFTFDLHNEHPELLVFTQFFFIFSSLFTTLINQVLVGTLRQDSSSTFCAILRSLQIAFSCSWKNRE